MAIDGYLVVEAIGKIKVNPLSNYKNVTHDIYRIPLSDKDLVNFKLNMLREIHSGYGWLKLPLFALDGLSTALLRLFGRNTPVFFFTRRFGVTNFRVCSQYVVWGIHKFTSYRFRDKDNKEVNWRIVSPDLLEDLLKLNLNGAILIHKQPK